MIMVWDFRSWPYVSTAQIRIRHVLWSVIALSAATSEGCWNWPGMVVMDERKKEEEKKNCLPCAEWIGRHRKGVEEEPEFSVASIDWEPSGQGCLHFKLAPI